MADKIKNSGQGRIFRNNSLEIFTKTSPAITLISYSSIIALLLWHAHANGKLVFPRSLYFYLGGLFFWTLFEYVMHRFLFHFISHSKFSKRFHYVIHGVHHEYPRDEQRVFMPPLPGVIIITIIYFFALFLIRNNASVFIPGLITGYLFYSFLHYSIHKFRPPKPLKKLWRHHLMHHYQTPDKAFGVSSMIWDRVFGTLPPGNTQSVKKSQKHDEVKRVNGMANT